MPQGCPAICLSMTATRARGRLSGGLFILLAGDREQHLPLPFNPLLTLFRLGSRSTGLLSARRLHTLAQCLHQVHHIGACRLPWSLDLLALLLLTKQVLQRIFVVILELFGLELPSLGVHDVDRQGRQCRNNPPAGGPRRDTAASHRPCLCFAVRAR